ncbi:unnamed protein product, partial [Porites lobata]
MIDMDPTDMTCIYSTLSFISDQASRYEYTPIITFDQPLWWKSLKIVSNEPQDSKLESIILRLGGLHEVLELVYAKNAVPHILSGKAVTRAIRGHFLVDAALNAMLVSDTFSLPLSATLDEANTEEEPVVPQPSIDEDLESAKSAYIYCQQMQDLPNMHPQVNRSFLNGLHVVPRSDRFWAGLSTDLIIEQVLMRSMKTTGGLTRGWGMSETQRLVWLMSMPACADINNSMQNLTGTNFLTSEQHKDTTKARKEHNQQDTNTIICYLSKRSPFDSESSLHNIATGVVADDRKILASLTGKNAHEYAFHKKDQVVTLACKTAVRLNDGDVQVNPQLMFQRLSIMATTGGFESPQQFFEYEVCSVPASLFDPSLLLLKANKPVLADANLYVRHRYPRATIVFDGYDNGPTTKDCTHQQRGHGCGPAINAQFRQLAGVFNRSDSLREDVIEAGEKALLSVFNAASTESLNSLRYIKYCQKEATGNVCLQPENLPPTSSAASFHSLRVYLQVQEWKQNQLRPQD